MILRTMLLALAVLMPTAGAQSTAEAPTIQVLIAEVRQLRQALERSAVVVPRMQLAMQRIQLQDQKAARVSAQLETVRREIAGQAAPIQHATQQLTQIEQQLSAETDSVRRKQLES